MYYVGKLDWEIYSCITSDIVTDEVIITDERIQHIIEKHPGDLKDTASTYIRWFLHRITS